MCKEIKIGVCNKCLEVLTKEYVNKNRSCECGCKEYLSVEEMAEKIRRLRKRVKFLSVW